MAASTIRSFPGMGPVLVCRPALPGDTPAVLEMVKHIWGGEDYIPLVWQDWLADPKGLLAVAEYGGRLVGIGKLTRLSPKAWWMEGLRIHPEFEGRGFASHMTDYQLEYWQRYASGVVRLMTASFNTPVHRMCARTGFTQVGDYAPHAAPSLESDKKENLPFAPVSMEEIPRATQFAIQSPSLRLSWGLMELEYSWAEPDETLLREIRCKNRLWWWRDGTGLLGTWLDTEEPDSSYTYLSLLACPLAEVEQLLQDYRRLAGSQGYSKAGWNAPLRPDLQSILEKCTFSRTWEHSMHVFEKRHP